MLIVYEALMHPVINSDRLIPPLRTFGGADHRGSARTRGRSEDVRSGLKHGISEATLYNWKAKCVGLDVSEARRLKPLEDENRKLKKLLAESMLDIVRGTTRKLESSQQAVANLLHPLRSAEPLSR